MQSDNDEAKSAGCEAEGRGPVPTPWTPIDSTEIVNDRWLRLTADRCVTADGTLIEPYYVVHERDWVQVVAMTKDARILVVRQFRHAARVVCVEFPGGIVDEGETPLQAAQRELLEETGHRAADWRFIGSSYANPARQTNSVHVFLAEGVVHVSEQQLDHGEELTWESLAVEELERLIDSGEFSHALHVAAFYRSMAVLSRGLDVAARQE